MWIGGLELRTAAADLAQQAAPRRQVRFCPVEDAPDDVEPVGATVEGKLRLGAAFAGQIGHAFRVDIGRIGNDQVVALAVQRLEQIAAVQREPVLQPIIADIARGDFECIL